MADEGTASTLVLIGAILELLMFLGFIAMIAMLYITLSWIPIIGMMVFIMSAIIFIVFDVFGIIFMIIWFRWRGEPCAHRTGLIVTGILGLFLAGFLPGLLVLIAGFICPSEAA